MADPAPLLPKAVVEQTKRIAAGIRAGEVAPLVGAGISQQCHLPGWSQLVDRLIRAWQAWDDSAAAQRLSPSNYVRLIRQTFGPDLEVVSYLRRRVEEGEMSFSQVVYTAVYAHPAVPYELFSPTPNDLHRHLIATFARSPRRIWTTNYDDLLEVAAQGAEIPARTLDPDRRTTNRDLLIAHVHGFLAPPDRTGDHPAPGEARVVLAEDDYLAIASDVIGWTNREFHRLFDEHSTLILGMSLADPNLRRALAARSNADSAVELPHFAVMRAVGMDDLTLPRTRITTRSAYAKDASNFRSWYWGRSAVEIVELPNHDSLLPFLVRLRYESFGVRRGDLWEEGARIGYQALQPWRSDRQELARLVLERAVQLLRERFGVDDPEEIVEIGMFLLKPDARTLELTFRGGSHAVAAPAARQFSADPDSPTGVAGRVFVSGAAVRVSRRDPLHDYGIPDSELSSPSVLYEGIISVPIVDWRQGGAPLGVIYVTTSRTDGALFQLSAEPIAEPDRPSLNDLVEWLSVLAMKLLSSWRPGPATAT